MGLAPILIAPEFTLGERTPKTKVLSPGGNPVTADHVYKGTLRKNDEHAKEK